MKTVLCYGDSLTWGYDAEGGRHALQDRWPSVLQAGLGGGVQVIADGLNGRTTAFDDHLAGADRNGARLLPTVLTTHEGALWETTADGPMRLRSWLRHEVINAVLTTMQGRRYLAQSVAAKLANHLDLHQLSRREMEILRLMATGLSNKGIAKQAGITEGTVKFHVNSILAKLECTTRTEAVALAVKRGLIQLA